MTRGKRTEVIDAEELDTLDDESLAAQYPFLSEPWSVEEPSVEATKGESPAKVAEAADSPTTEAPKPETAKPPPAANLPDPPKVVPVLSAFVAGSPDIAPVAVRPGLCVELMVGETLRLAGSARAVSITGETPGHQSMIAEDMAGNSHRVAIIVCEPEIIPWVQRFLVKRAHGGEEVNATKVRALVRSLANHCERFNGTRDSLAGVNLSNYG